MKFIRFLLLLSCTSIAYSQAKPLNEKELFESGLAAYRSKLYPTSIKTFESMIANFPEGDHYTAGLLMLSKSYEKMRYFKKSITVADELITVYPGSKYIDDALYTRAQSYYGNDDYTSAIKDLTLLRTTSKEKHLQSRSDSLIRRIIQNNLSSIRIRKMMETGNDPELLSVLNSQYVTNLMSQKRYAFLQKFIDSSLQKKNQLSTNKAFRDILKQINNKTDGPVRFGFITSLTGSNSETGRSIKSGVELAVSEHNRSYTPSIELVIYDDQSDIIQAIHAAKELSADDGISAIIGPVESSAMAAAAVVADQHHIPIISPTATKSGLTQIGPYVYQANVNIESRSEAIARYAVEALGLRTFAILSPSDLYGDIASTAFAQSVEKIGGRMIVIEKFYDNTTDFKGQLVHLRKMGFIDRALRQTSFRFLSKLTTQQVDSIYAKHYPIDSTSNDGEYNVPMEFIDALFLPVYTDDIKYIAPQLAFYNIKTQLLGGDNWYDQTELRLHQNYINGVMFVSESFMDPANPEVKHFNETFMKTNGILPSREASYGFDLMNMLSSFVQAGYYTSEEIQVELNKGLAWNGIHNKIIFTNDSRVNSSVHILQFSNGQIKKKSK
ncbi:penicillin-binding protein activator [bacterium]|nr:penicillin-binding protein activator [bacterium]